MWHSTHPCARDSLTFHWLPSQSPHLHSPSALSTCTQGKGCSKTDVVVQIHKHCMDAYLKCFVQTTGKSFVSQIRSVAMAVHTVNCKCLNWICMFRHHKPICMGGNDIRSYSNRRAAGFLRFHHSRFEVIIFCHVASDTNDEIWFEWPEHPDWQRYICSNAFLITFQTTS